MFLVTSFQALSQTEYECRELLSQITSFEDMELLQPIFPDWSITSNIVTPFEESGYFGDTIVLNAPLFSIHKKAGHYGYLLKVIEKEKMEFCKLKYILINPSELTIAEINQLQDEIISEFNSGKTSDELVQKHQRDGHSTVELDWFTKETMASEFEEAVWERSANEAFKLNMPERDWYYVVFKTHANVEAEVAHCVKVKICQVGCPNIDPRMEMPEISAEFPGGSEAMAKFITDNVKYPQIALKNRTVGQVILSFIVEADGTLTNISIEKGVSPALNNEAIRIVKAMPHWIPATHHGDKVRSGCKLPITFKL